jgi:hypothetical protein
MASITSVSAHITPCVKFRTWWSGWQEFAVNWKKRMFYEKVSPDQVRRTVSIVAGYSGKGRAKHGKELLNR